MSEPTDTATLPHHALALHRLQAGNRINRNLPRAGLEIGDEGGSVDVVLPHVVVVDRFLVEQLLPNQEIHRTLNGIGSHEERASVNLAQDSAVDLNERVRADHLEVEDDPFRD